MKNFKAGPAVIHANLFNVQSEQSYLGTTTIEYQYADFQICNVVLFETYSG